MNPVVLSHNYICLILKKVYLLLTHAILACNGPDAGEISNIRMVVGKNANG